MSKKEDSLENVNYSLPKLGAFKWITITSVIFIITFILYFPISRSIKSTIVDMAYKMPGCPLKVEQIQFELFMPKAIIKKISVPRRCFGSFGKDLIVKNTHINFRGFTFSPLGPHFKIETNLLGNNFHALTTIGFKEILVNLQNNSLILERLREDFPQIKASGKIKIDAKLSMMNQKINNLNLNIRSKDLNFLPQNISGFKLSSLPINQLLLRANMKKKDLIIKDFVLGDLNSPIRSNFKGKIVPNMRNFQYSNADLRGEVAFSSNFIQKYMIIDMIMKKFDKKDNFYQLEIKGPLTIQNIKSPRKNE
ncbi:MAG: hypothetical protein N4A33_06745 [Bacteriovoracaceae bacterium]|jgi:hypothetical protein|nr:hypothetical protein [Bacteriovoracaceae bacterium]